MATKDQVNAAVIKFGQLRCKATGITEPKEWDTAEITPPLNIDDHDSLLKTLKLDNISTTIGVQQMIKCTTWAMLATSVYDAQMK